MDSPFRILKIQYQNWIQRPQKPKYHQFYQGSNIFDNFGPRYWIRFFEFWKSNIRFGFNDPRNLSIISFIKIRTFLIILVRHIGCAILNFEILTPYVFGFSDPKNSTIDNFIKVRTYLMIHVRHIGSAILNFENPTLDLDSETPKTFFYLSTIKSDYIK